MNSTLDAEKPMTPLVGRLLVLAAVVLWSTSGFFAKHPAFDVWPDAHRGMLFAFWRSWIAAVLIMPLVRRPRWNARLPAMALCFAGMSFTFLSAMSLTTAANTIWLQYTAPWWIFGISTLLLKQPVARRDLTTLAVGALGVGLILFFEVQGKNQLGVAYGLASALFYAGVIMFLRSLRAQDTAWLIVVNLLATAAVTAPFALSTGIWPAGWQWPLLVAFAFFQMSLPYVLFGRGLRGISSQEAALLGLLEPVILPCWAWLVRSETPAPWTLAGAAFILLGLALRYLPQPPSPQR